ncbi:hypothetical protein PM082_013893 [Marasmius tenuissimus]|nr:hypothetical protein PM082_013893 [Marasmius tenuissimus]
MVRDHLRSVESPRRFKCSLLGERDTTLVTVKFLVICCFCVVACSAGSGSTKSVVEPFLVYRVHLVFGFHDNFHR